MPEKHVITLSHRSDKKNSVRWDADEERQLVTSIYVNRPYAETARKIRVTIEEVE